MHYYYVTSIITVIIISIVGLPLLFMMIIISMTDNSSTYTPASTANHDPARATGDEEGVYRAKEDEKIGRKGGGQ